MISTKSLMPCSLKGRTDARHAMHLAYMLALRFNFCAQFLSSFWVITCNLEWILLLVKMKCYTFKINERFNNSIY